MKKSMNHIALFIALFALAITGCKKDTPEAEKPKATLSNIEVGSGNNGIGVIGKDFHFNADIVAGDKIDIIQIKIEPMAGEAYSKTWSHEVKWEQYQGARNTNVHKHFNIPADAPEGKYNFLIIVKDQNGTTLEEKRTVTLYLEENLPVNPELQIFTITKNNSSDYFYNDGKFTNPADTRFSKNAILASQVGISGVSGNGIMYVLLIKKSLNHRPETVDAIDFSKAIVYDVFEHKDQPNKYTFTNLIAELNTTTWTVTIIRDRPQFTIGASADNNTPANTITGDKAWSNGDYYFGVVYKNTTNNFHFYHYIELGIDGL